MQYGVCGGPDVAAAAAQAGFDYFEWTVGDLLRPRESRGGFENALAKARKAKLPCPVVNCFLPADLRVTGPDVSLLALEKYVATAFRRAQEAGVGVIVFGSGGARRIPEGFARNVARDQLIGFCRMLAPAAQSHGVTVAVEPLHRGECNVLTSVRECAEFVREVDHPAVRLLVDAFHWAREGETAEDIVANGNLLVHAHIGTAESRLAPGAEECDFIPFLNALETAGYRGRVSVEAGIPDPPRDLPRALALMKSLAE